jgi:NADP-reducing hydrogenase subunit HndC
MEVKQMPLSNFEGKMILVCCGTGCQASGSMGVYHAFKEQLADNSEVEVKTYTKSTGCNGWCEKGPLVKIMPDDITYLHVSTADVPEIIEKTIVNHKLVERLLYKDPVTKKRVQSHHQIDFYKKQHKTALRNIGEIDPALIDDYIAVGGYANLDKMLNHMTPDQVVQEILASGLRGRGGGGFPTGLKWKLCAAVGRCPKYVICNGDEGDPGAFMDRSVLEGDPHVVLEAMTIAGYAIGAHQGYIYVRAEYPIAIHRLEIAIKQAREYGFLGKDIFGTGFEFDIELRLGSGAFVCGEETALMTSIEGNRGEPRPRPPFPAVKGLFGKPTILNNVETYANVPRIILNGADWFASMGTERSKGTKVFCLVGKINNTGLVEIPMEANQSAPFRMMRGTLA